MYDFVAHSPNNLSLFFLFYFTFWNAFCNSSIILLVLLNTFSYLIRSYNLSFSMKNTLFYYFYHIFQLIPTTYQHNFFHLFKFHFSLTHPSFRHTDYQLLLHFIFIFIIFITTIFLFNFYLSQTVILSGFFSSPPKLLFFSSFQLFFLFILSSIPLSLT